MNELVIPNNGSMKDWNKWINDLLTHMQEEWKNYLYWATFVGFLIQILL